MQIGRVIAGVFLTWRVITDETVFVGPPRTALRVGVLKLGAAVIPGTVDDET